MKKARFLLLTLLAVLGYSGALAAETVSNYTVDFNTDIATSKPITVARNWGHIVGSASYSYSNSEGVDDSGALLVYGQTDQDILVTPLVSGDISLWVKRGISSNSSNHAYIEFYAVSEDGATAGDLLTERIDLGYYGDGGNADYQQVSLSVSDYQRIGIRGQYVYFDNFTASSANIIDEAKLSIKTAVPSATNGTILWEQQPNGKVLVSYTVTVENTGDVQLTPGTDGYSVTLVNASDNADVATVNVPFTLAPGAVSDEFVVSAEVETSLWPNSYTFKEFNLRENITGNTVSRAQSHYTEYTPKFLFLTAGEAIYPSTSSLDEEQNFGVISAAVTKQYQISNNGIAPLTIKRITVPEGFTSDAPTSEFTLARKTAEGEVSSQEINITLPATTKGKYSGQLEIVYLDKDGNEQTYRLPLSGQVISANTWKSDFGTNSLSFPEGAVLSSTTLYGAYTGSGTSADGYLKSYNRHDYNFFITPLLHADASDQLTFDALKYQTGDSYYIKVYVSKDRSDWSTQYDSAGNPEWGTPVLTVSNKDLASTNVRYNYAIDFAEAGDYYIAFEVYGTGLDNIIGLEKQVTPAHDLFVKAYTLPAEVQANAELTAKLTVIPLTNESASNYTVKYYVGGEAVASATSVALSRSLTSSQAKDFSISYTPTTGGKYDTYIAVEFTDGTVITTPHQELKVTFAPEFYFLSETSYLSKWYAPTNVSSEQNYGIVNTPGIEKKFYLCNYGSAPLKVKSVTVPEGFTTDFPAEGVTIDPYDKVNQGNVNTLTSNTNLYPVNIVFSAETPGSYEGPVSVVYVDYDDDFNEVDVTWTSTFKVVGKMLDPNKWFADFGTASDAFPNGSLAQANITSSTLTAGDGSLVSSSDNKNLFITPLLRAEANEVVTFDIQARSSYVTASSPGYVSVYLIDDHVAAAKTENDTQFDALNPILVETIKVTNADQPAGQWAPQSVKIPTAGEYYLAFKISDARVDNINGLELVEIGHEWVDVAATYPAEAMQNSTATATVKLRNIGLQAETDYTATVYVDGEAYEGTVSTEIPVVNRLTATQTSVTVTFRPHTVGENLPIYIELTADDYTVATEEGTITITDEVASGDLTIGTPNGTATDSPLNLNYNNSESVTLYDAATLKTYGLKAGDKIKKITYKGYKTTDEQTTSFQVYYKWTDDQSLSSPASAYPYAAEENDFEKLIDENHTWQKIGSSASNLGDMIVLDFEDAPLVYEEGKSLEIYMHSYVDSYKLANFEKSNISNNFCYERQQDAASISNSWNKKNPAVLHLELAVEPASINGVVTNADGQPIEGATVTLYNEENDVKYSGTTDAEGAYSINVVQGSLTYVATAAAEGYDDAEEEVDFASAEGGVLTQDFTLTLTPEFLTVTIKDGFEGTTVGSKYALDFSGVEGLTVYKATGKVGSTKAYIQTDEVTGVVPAEEGILVKGAAGTYQVPLAADNAAVESDFSDNLLVAAVDGYQPTDDDINDQTIYRYVKTVSGESGFQLVTKLSQTVGVGKAYLRLTAELAAAAAALGIEFAEGEVTAIEGISRDQLQSDAPVYNLAGQRVEKSYKGVVIQNGKKYIKK